jgi:hypothetical protein
MSSVRKFSALFLFVVLSIALISFPASMLAQPESAGNEAYMDIDCEATLSSAEGQETAKELGICGQGQELPGDPVTDNTVYGNCGWITLSATNDGDGKITIRYTFVSTLGQMDWIDYKIFWSNSNGNQYDYTGVATPFDTSWYDQDRYYTGAGDVFVSMYHSYVILSNGIVCQGLKPYATVHVTGPT